MKELDFDELDRAVNSLVTQVDDGKPDSGASDEQKKPTPLPAKKAPSQPAAGPDASTARTIAVTTGHRNPRLDAKRPAKPSAGVIDIMAPSPSPAPKPNVSRTSPRIQPLSTKEDLKPEAPTPATDKLAGLVTEPTESQPLAPAEKPQPAKKAVAKAPGEENWPDPLDFHADQLDTAKTVDKRTTLQDEPKETAKAGPQQASDNSPFIPGAKVEKRPLGAFADEPPAEGKAVAKPALPEDHSSPSQAAQVPEELKPEVLAVESDEKANPKAPLATETPESAEDKNATATQQVRNSAMMSIPQQYKVANKPVDDSPRPVFDTKEYHPPLLEATAHGAHQGSPWGKLFIALLVVLVLAVGGYFAFIYFVQHY